MTMADRAITRRDFMRTGAAVAVEERRELDRSAAKCGPRCPTAIGG